jgi:hypothetical protein
VPGSVTRGCYTNSAMPRVKESCARRERALMRLIVITVVVLLCPLSVLSGAALQAAHDQGGVYLEGPGDSGPATKEFVVLEGIGTPYHPTIGFIDWACEIRGGDKGRSRLAHGRAGFSATKEKNRDPIFQVVGDTSFAPDSKGEKRGRLGLRKGSLIAVVPQYYNCWIVTRLRPGQ